MITPNHQVGWWGIPGGSSSLSTKTHLALKGKPACGSRLRSTMEFQWCSRGIHTLDPECKRCLKAIVKLRRPPPTLWERLLG